MREYLPTLLRTNAARLQVLPYVAAGYLNGSMQEETIQWVLLAAGVGLTVMALDSKIYPSVRNLREERVDWSTGRVEGARYRPSETPTALTLDEALWPFVVGAGAGAFGYFMGAL